MRSEAIVLWIWQAVCLAVCLAGGYDIRTGAYVAPLLTVVQYFTLQVCILFGILLAVVWFKCAAELKAPASPEPPTHGPVA